MGSKGIARVESAVRIVLKYNEAFNRRGIDEISALLADDCVFETYHPGPDGTCYKGRDEVISYLKNIFSTTENSRLEIEDIFGFSIKCIARWKYNWITGAGRKEYIRGVDLFRIRNKLICERLSFIKGDIAVTEKTIHNV